MENQNQQPQAEQPAQQSSIQQQVVPLTKSNKSKLFLIIIFILLVTIPSGIYLFSIKNINQKKQSAITPTIPQNSPTPSIDPTANWKTYTDGKNSIIFKYPGNWYVQPDPKEAFNIFLDNHPFEIPGGTEFMTPIQISFNEAENTTTNEKFFIEKTLDEGTKRISSLYDPKSIQIKNLTVSEKKAVQISGVFGRGMLEGYYFKYTLIQMNNNLLVANLSNKEFDNIYDQILSTFKFTDQLTPALSTSKYNWVTISTSESASWKSYSKYGFTLKYPPDWREDISTPGENAPIVVLTSQTPCPTGAGCAGRESGIYIYLEDSKKQLTSKDYVTQYVIPLQKQNNASSIPKIIDIQPSYFSSIDATVVDGFSGAGNPGPTAFIYNRTTNNLGNKIIELSSDSIENDTVSKIFSTFKFTP